LSTAAIARKNWKAIRLSGNGRVTAVASRTLARAQSFIDECEAEVPSGGTVAALGSYDELLNRDDVDAIYIPLPTGIRKEWVLRAAQAKKHVLCEKPCAVHASDVEEMIAACDSSGVQFMDGVMFEHSARIAGLHRSLSDTDRFGTIRRIQTHFSFCGGDEFAKSNIRSDFDQEPHGCLGDLGWYCIRFTLRIMRGQLPVSLRGRILQAYGTGDRRVPSEFVGELDFEDGVTAAFYCSFLTVNQQTALITGSNGYVLLEDFVLPFYGAQLNWSVNQHDLEIDNCRWNFNRVTDTQRVREYASGEANSQEVVMVRRLGEIALSGKIDGELSRIALATQKVLDALRRSAASDGGKVTFR
jgi:predicted dehydrogenase